MAARVVLAVRRGRPSGARARRTPSDRLKARLYYRKNKVKLKLKRKRYLKKNKIFNKTKKLFKRTRPSFKAPKIHKPKFKKFKFNVPKRRK
jgi:hypothetical protein